MGVSTSSSRPPPAQANLPVPNGVSSQQLHQSYQRLGHNTDMSISRRSPYTTGPDGVARPNPSEVPLSEYSTTRTIRSQCNLRRDSIQLTPVPGQPYEYDFSFLFDCSADTNVTIHFLACDRMQVLQWPQRLLTLDCSVALHASHAPPIARNIARHASPGPRDAAD
jgi:hypothetical protein